MVIFGPDVPSMPKSNAPYIIRLLVSNGVFLALWLSPSTLSKLCLASGWIFSYKMVMKRSLSGLECSWTAPE